MEISLCEADVITKYTIEPDDVLSERIGRTSTRRSKEQPKGQEGTNATAIKSRKVD